MARGGGDIELLLREIRAASKRDGSGVSLTALIRFVDGDSGRLDRALADLDDRGLIRVIGGSSAHDGRAIAR